MADPGSSSLSQAALDMQSDHSAHGDSPSFVLITKIDQGYIPPQYSLAAS